MQSFTSLSKNMHLQHSIFSKRRHIRFLSSSVDSSQLTDQIREAYDQRETDGILQLASHQSDLLLSAVAPNDLVQASIQAAQGNKGKLASILNAWMASCCTMKDATLASDRAQQLLQAFDELDDLQPDMVTFCLAYTATFQSDSSASSILERAQKLSKKQAGSKRRKVLAASRRKPLATSATEHQSTLQELLGTDFKVLYETDQLLVVNKPAGVSCFHQRATTKRDLSLEEAFSKTNVPLSILNPDARGLVHRLDRGTSGCLVVAKTDEIHAQLVTEFFLRRVQKTYTTIVAPCVKLGVDDTGVIDYPVDGRPAQSKYRVVKRYARRAAQVELETWTGRKHQVRVHCAQALHCPVLWDDIYGNPDTDLPEELQCQLPASGQQRFFLHASTLLIPTFGVNVTAPIPSWWQPTLDALESVQAS